MIKRLKHILVSIAHLPSSDQRWIIRQLTPDQLTTLDQWQGLTLLQDAQRFRSLKPKRFDMAPPAPLPAYCEYLATQSPLYIAIILEQGLFSWRTIFLKRFDTNGIIQSLLDNQVVDIKPSVKQALLTEWGHSLSFEMHLESAHG